MSPICMQFVNWFASLSLAFVHLVLMHQIKMGQTTGLTPYSCSDPVTYPCKSSGVFSRPGDSSVYFECINKKNTWTVICYTCNSNLQTCFDEKVQACVSHAGTSCSSRTPRMDAPPEEKSYDCGGYTRNQNPFPCATTGAGLFPLPGDKSVYFECTKTLYSNTLEATCKTCPESTKSCFNPDELICEDNCGMNVDEYSIDIEQYHCSDHEFECLTMGTFAHPNDPGIYFSCLLINGKLVANCFSCSPFPKSCFNNHLQTCILEESVGPKCGNNLASVDTKKIIRARDYSCQNYFDFIFPCENYGAGTFPLAGDPTVYFTCTPDDAGDMSQSCVACNEAEQSCYHETTRMCVSPCPADSVEPRPVANSQYNCDLYTNVSYQCTSEGYFAHPSDSTVYFRCVKTGGKLIPVCYTCDSKFKTCFNNQKQTCVKNGGANCGNPGNSTGVSVTAYSCEGYTRSSFPCQHFGTGTYGTLGDVSIFFECAQTGNRWESKCFSCSKSAMTCFNDATSKCEKCSGMRSSGNKPPVYQCDVSKFNHNCGTNGTLSIASNSDHVYEIRCVWIEDHFDVMCITCTDLNRKSKCSRVDQFPEDMCRRYSGTVCIPGLVKSVDPPTTPRPVYTNSRNTAYQCVVQVNHECVRPGYTYFPADDPEYFYSIYCMRKGGGWKGLCNKCKRTSGGDRCAKTNVIPNFSQVSVTQSPFPQTTTKPTLKATRFLCNLNDFPFDCRMEGTLVIYGDPQEKYVVHCQQNYDHFEAYCLQCRLESTVGHHVCTIVNELPQYAPSWVKLTTEAPKQSIKARSGVKPTKIASTKSSTKIVPTTPPTLSTTTFRPKPMTTKMPTFTTNKPQLTTQRVQVSTTATTTVAATTGQNSVTFQQLECDTAQAHLYCEQTKESGSKEFPGGSLRYVKCVEKEDHWEMSCSICHRAADGKLQCKNVKKLPNYVSKGGDDSDVGVIQSFYEENNYDSLAEVDADLFCTPSNANKLCPVLGANGVHEYPQGSKRYVKCGQFQGKWMMACMTCNFDKDKIEDCDPNGRFNQWPNLDLDELSQPLTSL